MEDTRARWDRAYAEAVEFDSWGQVEEAVESYTRLLNAAAGEYAENVLQLPLKRREAVGKMAAVVKLRVQELQTPGAQRLGIEGMKKLKPFLKSILVADAPFPLRGINAEEVLGVTIVDDCPAPQPQQAHPPPSAPTKAAPAPAGPTSTTTTTSTGADGTLRPPPTSLQPGDVTLTIRLDKWGFKDATTYLEPRVTVSVWDEHGRMLEAPQETPVAKFSKGQYVVFDNLIYLQTPLNRLPPDAAIFLEFKHWKPKKRKA